MLQKQPIVVEASVSHTSTCKDVGVSPVREAVVEDLDVLAEIEYAIKCPTGENRGFQ